MNMKPDARRHNPDPAYIRSLIESAGITQLEAAQRIGKPVATVRRWLFDRQNKHALVCPYSAQYVLEQLAREKQS